MAMSGKHSLMMARADDRNDGATGRGTRRDAIATNAPFQSAQERERQGTGGDTERRKPQRYGAEHIGRGICLPVSKRLPGKVLKNCQGNVLKNCRGEFLDKSGITCQARRNAPHDGKQGDVSPFFDTIGGARGGERGNTGRSAIRESHDDGEPVGGKQEAEAREAEREERRRAARPTAREARRKARTEA